MATEGNTYNQVILGPVAFAGFEIPNTLPLGGDQQTILTKFVGKNRRQVQVLGAQPRDLAWRGIFLYESAMDRARFLDGMRIQGSTLRFQWGDFLFDVVIRRFWFDPANVNHIPYEIELEVVNDLTAPINVLTPSQDTVETGIQVLIEGVENAVLALERVVTLISAARRGDVNGIIGASSSLTTSIAVFAGSVSSQAPEVLSGWAARATIISVQAAGTVDSFTSFRKGGVVSQIDQTGAGVQELISLSASMTDLASMLTRLTSPPVVLNVPVVKDNVFAVAARYYGDVNAWEAIADFNHLTAAQLLGPQVLKLPPINGVLPNAQTAPTIYESVIANVPNPVGQ